MVLDLFADLGPVPGFIELRAASNEDLLLEGVRSFWL
jgi:hypothetical protein